MTWRKPAALVTAGVILLVFGGLLGHFRLAFHDRNATVDDAFIVFRYAENFVAGHGFRWNATGTPSEGFSSTAFVVGIAGLIRLGMDPVVAALVLNLAGAAALAAGLLAASGRRTWTAPVTCLPILYVITDPNFAGHASRGLETQAVPRGPAVGRRNGCHPSRHSGRHRPCERPAVPDALFPRHG